MSEQQNVKKEKQDSALKPIIEISGLKKIYRLGKEKVLALDGINLTINRGEICCLLGTSGSGKSTLLNMMAGLEKPTKGAVTIRGERIDKMSEKKLAIFRQKYMGFVFQSYNLLPNLTALDNVGLPLAFRGLPKAIRNKRARAILKNVGLGNRMKHKPTQMSGGQQQRVGIARAFVGKPAIIFADEPTGNLDTKTTLEVMQMMVEMSRENNQTLIIVTHDNEIAVYADKIYHIIDGKIDKELTSEEIVQAEIASPVLSLSHNYPAAEMASADNAAEKEEVAEENNTQAEAEMVKNENGAVKAISALEKTAASE
ncbi:MAG: ABC transporter ATP-binding protein [Oscillospiraceae bacterium]